MPRSGSGSYTLPSGNPVVTGTTIESNWANTTLSDIATTLTDSLSRSGQGGMTAALRVADGTQGAPGVGFANETGSGFYRAGTGEVWAVVQGAQTLNLDANGVYVPGDKTTTVDGAFVFNEAGADKDARFEGDTDANLLFTDASTDRVGVGTNTPDAKLTVNGVAAVGDGAEAAPSLANTGDLNTGLWFPAADTLAVSVGGVESVRVSSAGNLGVGTQNPVEKVTAYAAAGASYGLRSTNYTYVIDTVDSTGAFRIRRNDGVTDTRLTIDSSGNLGIGTSSPGARLDVDGIIRSTGSTGASSPRINLLSSGYWTWGIYGDGNTFKIQNDANDRFFLDSSGNLGLGVTPSASTAKTFEIGGAGNTIIGFGTSMYLSMNAYYNVGFKYGQTGLAAQYAMDSGQHRWFTAPSGTAGNAITFTQALTLDANCNLLLNGTSAGASAVGTLAIFNGTAPTGSVTNGIILYAEDVSSSSELKVRDEAGNVTTLSPHNFSLIPEGPSEDMAWAYYSEKGGKRINVDMLKLARMVEKLTGEKLVYES